MTNYSAFHWSEKARKYAETVGTIFNVKGRVDTVNDLPSTGNKVGDLYLVGLVSDTDKQEYAWLNTDNDPHWEKLGSTATSLAFSAITGSPSDNTALGNALDAKANEDDLGMLAYSDKISDGDIDGTLSQSKITNLTTDLGNKVVKNNDITGATKCKITYDEKGLVTGGYDLVASDIPDLSNTYQTKLPTLQGGKFLTNDGSSLIWGNVDALPSQSGQSGKFLKTNGTIASWDTVDALPSQTGHSGSVLTTDGSSASWVGTSECSVVIESKRPTTADPTWYRVYSDGWVEQGGKIAAAFTGTITYSIEMADTNYYISTTLLTSKGGASYDRELYPNAITTTGFTTTNFSSASGNGGYWEVKGYKA